MRMFRIHRRTHWFEMLLKSVPLNDWFLNSLFRLQIADRPTCFYLLSCLKLAPNDNWIIQLWFEIETYSNSARCQHCQNLIWKQLHSINKTTNLIQIYLFFFYQNRFEIETD